jgi:general secretion pathway protein C
LVANTANAIFAAWLQPDVTTVTGSAPSSESNQRTWAQRQVIISRNLFHSSALTPPPPAAGLIEEDLEETQLPLRLWGTIAAASPALAWASVEDLDARESNTVKVGDKIKSATVVGIERKRVVLLEGGKRRSLTLDEEEVASAPTRTSSIGRPSRSTRSARSARSARARARARSTTSLAEARAAREKRQGIRQVGEDHFEVGRSDIQDAINDPSSLISQARIVPSIDEETGEMNGIQISGIEPGSVFEQVGIREGEVITEVGGVPIQDVGQSAQILGSIADQSEVAIIVRDQEGNTRPLTLSIPSQ